jgi:hypothetical protein
MTEWSFLTNHARALVCIAHDPGARLRDIALTLGITERSAYAIVTDLAAAGYVVKDKDTDRRRNRYTIRAHLPLPETIGRERTIGEVLDVLVDSGARNRPDEGVGEPERDRARHNPGGGGPRGPGRPAGVPDRACPASEGGGTGTVVSRGGAISPIEGVVS